MSLETYSWVLAFHILGFMAWTATLTSALHTMRAHTSGGVGTGSEAFLKLEKLTGIAMDASALVAIACGLYLLLGEFDMYMERAYMHIKLTAVAALIALHVVTRIKLRKVRNGDMAAFKPWLITIAYALIFVIVLSVVAGPVVFKG